MRKRVARAVAVAVVILCMVLVVVGAEEREVNSEYMQREFLEKGITLEELVIRSGERVEKSREMRKQTALCVEWVAFVGDSITRNLFVEYLSLFFPSSSFTPNYDLFKGQRDFDYIFHSSSSSSSLPSLLDLQPSGEGGGEEEFEGGVGGGYPSFGSFRSEMECEGEGGKEWRVSFYWRPFIDNSTSFLLQQLLPSQTRPNEIVWSGGSWDMLHINDLQSFSSSLASLRSSLLSLPSPISSSFLNIGPFNEPSLPSSKSNLSNPSALSFNSLLTLYLTSDPSFTVIDKYTFLSHYIDQLSGDGVHPSPLLTSFLLQIWLNSFPPSSPHSHLLVNTRNQPLDHPLTNNNNNVNNNNVNIENIINENINHNIDNNNTNSNNNNNINITLQGAEGNTAKKGEGFIGKDPFLGALVGLYLLAVFFTRDPFLLSNFLLFLSSRYFH